MQNYRRKSQPDWWVGLITLSLVCFGLVMISSASVVISFERYGYNYYFFVRQLINLGVGIVAWIVCTKIDYRLWRRISLWLFLITLLLLILVLIPGIGHKLGGASRWIMIDSIGFQPSELAKLTVVIYLAAWLEKRKEKIRILFTGYLPFLVILGLFALLIMAQPDMGTTVVIVATAIVMVYMAGARPLHLGATTTLAALAFLALVKSAPYRWQRLMTFFNPSAESLGAGYHISQALLAIGSGGLWGLGFGQSKQKYLYLPQPHSDSIFAIITEELGFIRALVVLMVFAALFVRGFSIARRAPDNFARNLSVGITGWLFVQTFINIAAMLGILPLTGVPLPFVSAGGSSLVASLAAIGILMNISKQIER